MASQLHYLTVQDVLWINQQITEKIETFHYAKLEEATYYQYAYGESRDVISQSARFLVGFPKMNPLEAGNAATTFVSLLTFLQLNGYHITLKDSEAVAWYESVQSGSAKASDAIKAIAKQDLGHHHPADVRSVVKDVLRDYSNAITALR